MNIRPKNVPPNIPENPATPITCRISAPAPFATANGNTLDKANRLVTAEHGAHRISRTAADGIVETLVEQFEGKNLNSPNDAVVKSDGSIWFTDPDYGLAGRKKEQPGNYVYRLDPASALLITASFSRARSKYGIRGYRNVLLEAGHAAQNVLLAAAALGVAACPVGGFVDEGLNSLLALDGVGRAVVYLLRLGRVGRDLR